MLTQNEMIANHLREFGSITQMEAINEYGCFRLSARIHDLRSKGMDIDTIDTVRVNRYGVKVRFARYVLNGESYEQ